MEITDTTLLLTFLLLNWALIKILTATGPLLTEVKREFRATMREVNHNGSLLKLMKDELRITMRSLTR